MPGIANVGALAAVVMDTRLSRKEQQHDPDISVLARVSKASGSSSAAVGSSAARCTQTGHWAEEAMASASGYRSLGTDRFFMVLPIKKQKSGELFV
ncbi:hypothetical protein PVAP13_1NG048100 [Panicum virgatum]|uniref:Uncharacterized protein n=1 Tax=Panicum virgatum TaxID=38727 RepID=A0A8T0WTS6_PANVG|nr:hypothetical protein PVAP13_1NG048100 [Panicum virgatum]